MAAGAAPVPAPQPCSLRLSAMRSLRRFMGHLIAAALTRQWPYSEKRPVGHKPRSLHREVVLFHLPWNLRPTCNYSFPGRLSIFARGSFRLVWHLRDIWAAGLLLVMAWSFLSRLLLAWGCVGTNHACVVRP